MTCPDVKTSSLDDGRLIKVIAGRGSHDFSAKEAWAELYHRHAEVLKNACLHYGQRLPASSGVKDLVADTFIEAYTHAHTYRRPMGSQVNLTRWTHKWLFRIATRLFLDKLSLPTGTHQAETLWARTNSPVTSQAATDAQPTTARLQRLKRATQELDQLSRRDRELLIVSLDWFNTGVRRFEVPRPLIAEICRRHRISPNAYRQARDRAFERIRQAFRQAGEKVA